MKRKYVRGLVKSLTTLSVFLGSSLGWSKDIDLSKSVFQWTGTKVTGKHTGKISLKSGSLEEDAGNLKGGEFVMDMGSFTVEDLDGEYKTKFLNHMKSGDFFQVDKFPTATLKIKSVKADSVTGDLTIKGKTNEITFPVKKEGNSFKGTMTFNRTKFDMIYSSGNFFKDLGDKMIHDEVKIEFTVVEK